MSTRFAGRWGRAKIDPNKVISPVVQGPFIRDAASPPKRATFTPGVCAPPPQNTYTGDAMLGIGTMHKSNAVPVFSVEEAQDLAKMRRG